VARIDFPHLVVDLGCGTGLSTRYWAERAEQVIGIDPTPDMLRQARQATRASNVVYREGFSHRTGLAGGCADVVFCGQSLHWMEPQPTFEEARRILIDGGMFAACDYDWPPTTGSWEADAAYENCMRTVAQKEKALPGYTRARQWPKGEHLARIRSSGCFRYAKEIVVHHVDRGNAERLVGLALSQGRVVSLLKRGLSESDLGIDQLRDVADRSLGSSLQTWYWSARIRLGVR
jgi:SAM-dependent methyltransferase